MTPTDKRKKLTIAIDGFSSCGKSTFAKIIAARLGYVFIDTGAMYRAVTLYALENGIIDGGILDSQALEESLDRIDISFRFNPARGASDIYVNGRMVEGLIRTIAVSNCVSEVSSLRPVRTKLVALQQSIGAGGGVVLDGRDIGTVVFPDADIKLFMTADVQVRARRRYDELLAAGQNVSLQQIEENIRKRDIADQQRQVSPLRKADDAIVLDNSAMTVEEQLQWFMKIYEKACESK